ncbi:hypothetical protein PLICRDRAFT_109044 [Plicaturopsis crispa FD-325 SS-3]|nr:hypothetical protein PLICRDRAFT_109044 [Plicaturopsis crispa FD-325 SS-3]
MGAVLSFTSECFPGKPRFSEADIPDLTGKVVIVTGGNSGVGKVLSQALLAHNATVYIAARSEKKARGAIEEMKSATGEDSIHFLKLDLADLGSVKAAAEDFLSKETRLDVLYNNAGVMVPPIEALTVNGYDLTLGVNVLGHFYLTKLLLPTLTATASASPRGSVRVVNTSSAAQWFFDIDFATFRDGPARRKAGVKALYAQSKNGNVVFANELARRFEDTGVVSMSFNPGNLATNLQRHLSKIEYAFVKLLLSPVEKFGASSPLYAGFSPDGVALNGKYIIPWARLGPSRAKTRDPQLGHELWKYLEEQVAGI